MVAKKERIFYYDVLRAFAILFVILCHTSTFYNWTGQVTTPINIIASNTIYDLASLGVPIFFMISGALLINRDYELGDFLKRRFGRLVWPYVFWVGVLLIGIYYLDGTSHLLGMLLGFDGFTWFIWVLMGMYLFIPVFNPFMKRYGLRGAEYFLILWFLSVILTQFDLSSLWELDLRFFSGWFGLFVLGYYLDNKEFKIGEDKLCIVGFLMFIVPLVFLVYMEFINVIPGFELSIGRYLYIITIIIASGLFLFMKYSKKINLLKDKFIGKAIVSVSMCSYGMYFTHVIAVRPFLLIFKEPSWLIFALVFVAVSFGSWMVIYIFSKVPFLKRFSGC